MISLPNNSKYKKKTLYKAEGIAGKVKKFDEKLHSKYDIAARHALKCIFEDAVIENEDIYGEDMIFNIEKFPYKYLEVQVFSNWCTDKFPYSYPFVYARKMKFSDDTLFITFNKHYTEAIIFGKKSIDKNESRLKKYARECVHFVSWNKAMQLSTEDLTLDNIRAYSGVNI